MPAAYFSNFPFMGYSLNQSPQPGEFEWVTDIFRRTAPVASLVNNTRLFYPYQVEDGDSPEIVADKVYGSTKYHWVVTLFNGITDPLIDWPKKYSNLVTYINDKYGSVATAMATIHHYTMTKTKVDSNGETSTQTFIIDATKYASLTSLVPEVYTFSNGRTVTVTTSRSSVDSYTYEIDTNEAKRSIILLKTSYLPQVVAQLEQLMSAP